MRKLIGSARVSTRQQDTDRQATDLLASGDRRNDLYVDHGVLGARASRPVFDEALRARHDGDTLAITTLDRLGPMNAQHARTSKGPAGEGSIASGAKSWRGD